MKPDERKRRFNEAIVNTLYPPSPQHEQDSEPEENLIELESYTGVISGTLDECENASTSGEGEEEEHSSVTEKLTRAQRKRIRKKKMREESILRGNLIGPLMPPTQTTQAGDNDPPPVRSNVSKKGDETTRSSNAKRMKQRRMAKKVIKEKRVASPLDNCNQVSSSDAVDDAIIEDACCIMDCLEEFCPTSDQKLNPYKTHIYFSKRCGQEVA